MKPVPKENGAIAWWHRVGVMEKSNIARGSSAGEKRTGTDCPNGEDVLGSYSWVQPYDCGARLESGTESRAGQIPLGA
jgi:hypothetical protein